MKNNNDYKEKLKDQNDYVLAELQKIREDLESRDSNRTRELEAANEALLMEVAERLHVESALRNSEALFRGLAEFSPAMIFVFQGNKLRYVNPEFISISEYSEIECLNMNFWDIIHPDHKEIIKNRGLARQNGEPVPERYETKLRSRTGKEIWVDLYANLINYEGKPAVIGLLYDISERKRVEEALRQSEVMYRTIFETTGTAMMIFDDNMLVTLVNTEFENLSGYKKEEIHNKKYWPELVAPVDVPRMADYHRLRRVSPMLAPADYEFKLLNKQGHLKDVFITVDLIPGTTESVCSFMDITERRKAEAQVRYLSFNDKMTGIYNRAFFEEEFSRLNTQRQMPLSLIIGDVNGLKLINDAFGHECGDMLLRKVADILKKACRKEDIVARWGGDEFIILLPRTDQKSASKICERIFNISDSMSDLPIPISISLGLSSRSADPLEMRELIKEAEDKMYRNKLLESKSTRSSFVISLERTLWEKSHETEEHCQRLKKMAEDIGSIIDLPDGDLDNLKLLASLHDIGKVSIPDLILDKADKLSIHEWEIIKKHPETGYRIALTLPDLAPIAEAILAHHERWDGCGYPLGLREGHIPLISRVLAIVDAFDVMVQGRPYRKAISKNEALAEIQKCAGTQFDPELARVFCKFMKYQ
ncbi:MAG: PAS domain S-box protein [Syntrophomonas sp.]